jgi:hypothetical protein
MLSRSRADGEIEWKAWRASAISRGEESHMTVNRKTATSKTKSVQKSAGSYVLSPAKGPRTLSHKTIKAAVEKVFKERLARNV